jgi:RNA polymerase sigma-70 factor (ECF subfamily)
LVTPDDELLRRISRKDAEALSALYDRYAPVLFGLSVRILRDARDAEDVLQEVFIQVYRDAPRYEPERASPRTWLFTIARSRALDRLRSVRAAGRHLHEQEPPAVEESAPVAGVPQEQVLLARHVETQLAKLTDKERCVLRLAYYDGYTQEEIAEKLDEPLGTIKSRTRSALSKLRGFLAEDDERG